MKKEKICWGLIIISILFLSGCKELDLSQLSDSDLDRLAERVIICNEPYIRHGSDCCLDQNENGICDKDDEVEILEEETTEELIIDDEIEEESSKYPAPNNIDLSDFPKPFIENNEFNGFLVIGDKAVDESVIAISDISMALQFSPDGTEQIEITATKLSSEITDLSKQNIILVGYSDCEKESNFHLQTLLGDIDCRDYFQEGKGILELFDTGNNKVALIVSGGTPGDTRAISSKLANYGDYDFSGTKIEMTT